MTIIFLIAFGVFVINALNGHAVKAKPARFVAQPAKVATPKQQPPMNLSRRIRVALYGDKALVVELCRCDGDIINHRTNVHVQWANSATCNTLDGLQYHQFLMVLEGGKRLGLPITEKDGKRWITYQGQQYNRWDSAVHVRRGLLEVLGGSRKATCQAQRRNPAFG